MTAPERSEKIAEIAGRLIADGMPATEADHRAAAMVRADELNPQPLEGIRLLETERTWFIENLLTPGIAIVAAKKGNWKSLFALQASYALASGADFLGRMVPSVVPVLYLALELDEIAMSERAKKIGPVPVGLDVLFAFRRGDEALQDMESLLLARGYRVVVADMTAAILPGGIDGNAYDAVTGFMLRLRRLAQKYQACVLCLTHSPKGAKDDFADAVIGSVGFGGQADNILLLDRKRGDDTAKIFITGNHGRDQSFKISLDSNLRLHLADDGEPVSFLTSAQEETLNALRQYNEGTTSGTLGMAMQKTADAVRKTLEELQEKGLAYKPRRGVYMATSLRVDPDPF